MDVKAKIVSKMSKSGKPYMAVEIYLTNDCVKTIFLEPAEQSLIKLVYGNTNKESK